MYDIAYWFLIFFIFTNRGFLYGCYCPIYGFGSLLIIVLLKDYYDDPVVLFILSVVFTSILEYFTSWLMEKIFNDRWWDYTDNFANINGRVCLFNSLCFGVGALAINYLLYPMISHFLMKLNPILMIIFASISFVIIFTDFIITTQLAFKLKNQLQIIENYFSDIKIKFPKREKFDLKLINRLKKYKKMPDHFLNAFPHLKINRLEEIKTLKNIYKSKKQSK